MNSKTTFLTPFKYIFWMFLMVLGMNNSKAQTSFKVFTNNATTPTLDVGKDMTTTVNGRLKISEALIVPTIATSPDTAGQLALSSTTNELMVASGTTWKNILPAWKLIASDQSGSTLLSGSLANYSEILVLIYSYSPNAGQFTGSFVIPVVALTDGTNYIYNFGARSNSGNSSPVYIQSWFGYTKATKVISVVAGQNEYYIGTATTATTSWSVYGDAWSLFIYAR